MRQKFYPTSFTDAQWAIIEPFLPVPKVEGRTGRPRQYCYRDIVNGIFYVLRTGCSWDMMPNDLPPWLTCYHYFRKWKNNGTWQAMHDALRERLRVKMGRQPTPSAAIIDSQTVKTAGKGGLKNRTLLAMMQVSASKDASDIKGRKRHILVDTSGLLLGVVVHSAGIQDRDGAKLLMLRCKEQTKLPRLEQVWADGGYRGKALAEFVQQQCGWRLQIVDKPAGQKYFSVLPRRWVVERTFAWLGRYRRLAKDYDLLPKTNEAFIYLAMTHLMLKRLTQ